MTGLPNEEGKMVAVPYAISKGDIPSALLVQTQSAHSAKVNLVCHALLFSYGSFLMIKIKLLFDDSTKPLPCG